MKQRYRCLSICVRTAAMLLLTSGTVYADQPADFRLGNDVVPISQSIHLHLDAEQETYRGSVSIALEVKRPTSTFHFHSEGPELGSVRLSIDGQEIDSSHSPIGSDVVEVEVGSTLAVGTYRLDIEFTNPFDTKAVSLYRAQAGEHAYTFTQFEATDAREAFPCWDEPNFKIPYQMTLTVPVQHVAISNMPIEKESELDGWRTTEFAQSPPMPSYLLAIATGPFDLVEMPGLGVPARIATVKGQGELTSLALEVTPPILKALEAYFDQPYPYRKLDFIAVPEFWPGAMENPGAVTYADRLLVIDPATATVRQRRSQARVIAHELAHQWFGNLVTMEWWDDLWLNESFSDWMADKITHRLFPELGIDISSTTAGQRIMVTDARATSVAIRKPIGPTQNVMQDVGLAYSKGKTVLAMFEAWLGEETFRRGVLKYLKTRQWQNATAADLWRALAETSGKPLGETMATFIDQPGVPRLSVQLLGNGKARLSQARFKNFGAEIEQLQWRIPVTLRYGVGERIESVTVLVDQPTLIVDLALESDPDWIHPNGTAKGYYRWSLAPEALQALADHRPMLSAVERINLLSNVSALLRAGEVDGGTFLAVLTRMASDPEPMVVSAALSQLGLVESALVPDQLADAYGAWVGAAFGPAVERFGTRRRAGEPETVGLMRPVLLSLMVSDAKDEKIVSEFKDMGAAFLKDPSSVESALVMTALRTLAKDGDAELFDQLQSRAEAAEIPSLRARYLTSLGAFEDAALQQRAMTYALEGPVRPNEIFRVISGIGSTEAGRDKLFDFIVEKWDVLEQKLPPQFRSFVPQMATGCSEQRLRTAEELFGRPELQGPRIERAMVSLRESVRDCVTLREREQTSVAAYLTAFGG